MKRKIFTFWFLLVVITVTVCGQMLPDDSLLIFDRKINNDFISNYTLGNPQYFFKFGSLDTALLESGGFQYGCGIETALNVIYYFDMKFKSGILGYNSETGENFVKEAKHIAVTSTGKIYVTDEFYRKIFYWQRNQDDKFNPAGSIERVFQGILTICKDGEDRLYIVERVTGRIYKYDTGTESFLNFGADEYIQLPAGFDRTWLIVSGIDVNENGIYVLYAGGAIVKFNADGEYVTHYRINETNLHLMPAGSARETDTLLVGITTGPYGNIYLLDRNAGKIHIFNPELEYISSWEDPQRPFEPDVRDIHFIKEEGYILISYPWGFYTYKLQARLTGIDFQER